MEKNCEVIVCLTLGGSQIFLGFKELALVWQLFSKQLYKTEMLNRFPKIAPVLVTLCFSKRS